MTRYSIITCILTLCAVARPAYGGPASPPGNLAPRATISATSEYSKDYLAKFVADGRFPMAGGQQDVGEAWCVNGTTHRNGADLRFEWDEPVTVAEIVPEILEWAQGPLAHLTGDSLSDPRGQVVICDVAALIDDANDGTTDKYDAILLDVDNGPDGIVRDANYRIYSKTGLGKARDALKPGGILAVWSAAPDHKFTVRLKESGFEVEVREVRARPNNKGPRHTIWFARKR